MIIINNVDENAKERKHIAFYVRNVYDDGKNWFILEELEYVSYLTEDNTHYVWQYETKEVKRIQQFYGHYDSEGILNLYLAELAAAKIMKLEKIAFEKKL